MVHSKGHAAKVRCAVRKILGTAAVTDGLEVGRLAGKSAKRSTTHGLVCLKEVVESA